MYDERIGKYVAFGRFNKGNTFTTDVTYTSRTGAVYNVGRSVSRMQSDDFIHWTAPELVVTDDCDDPDSMQIDVMTVRMYEDMYVGVMDRDVRPFPRPHRPTQMAGTGRGWVIGPTTC